MAHSSAVPAVVPENTATRIHRATRENRSLWYHLMVLQEPVQARACTPGEVAKGHKRCIDPPPIISLRVIEGPTIEQGDDITSDYNVSFFLRANIEDALPPVACKGAQTLTSADPRPLFGARTSGMMYLDHLTKAGYFIFPTLVVDEKGWYRL
ncbi:velum formation- protein [Fusarium falciforme]